MLGCVVKCFKKVQHCFLLVLTNHVIIKNNTNNAIRANSIFTDDTTTSSENHHDHMAPTHSKPISLVLRDCKFGKQPKRR